MQAPKLFLDLCCQKQDPPHCNSPPLTHKKKNTLLLNLSTVVGCLSLASIFLFFFFFCPISGDANLHHPPPIAASFWCYFYWHPEFCNLVCPQVLVRPTLMVYCRTRGILDEGISWIYLLQKQRDHSSRRNLTDPLQQHTEILDEES